MKTNKEGLQLIKDSEGLRLDAYQDVVGVVTIGYGTTGKDIKMGMHWTEAECEARLVQDLEKFEKEVYSLINIPITSNQFSALVSFTYNLGAANLGKSTLLKLLNAGKISEAAEEFVKWNKAGGKVFKGLTDRRLRERALFLKPETQNTTAGLPDIPSDDEINKKLQEIEDSIKKDI